MLREDIERIESCQQQLREQLQRIPLPRIALEGDEDGQVIIGNEAAFLRLAIESMDVARGAGVAFDPPITADGSTASLVGMTFDANPTVSIPREQPWWGKFVAAAIVGVIVIVLLTGVIVDSTWLVHQIANAFRR